MKILNKPSHKCNVCDCKFEYEASDVKSYTEQYWSGFFNGNGLDGGWKFRNVNYILCPGCKTKIIVSKNK